MVDETHPATFLEKIEKVFENLKNELEGRIGVHIAILDGVSNAKVATLAASAEHFGEPLLQEDTEVGKSAPAQEAEISPTTITEGLPSDTE